MSRLRSSAGEGSSSLQTWEDQTPGKDDRFGRTVFPSCLALVLAGTAFKCTGDYWSLGQLRQVCGEVEVSLHDDHASLHQPWGYSCPTLGCP